jgi:glycosyltransferase involved in cell wall biosynthesis
LKALALVPRSLALLRQLKTQEPDVVHLFWGHYPSLLGLLVKRRLPGCIVSLFLGSYDLETRFPLSISLARQADLLVTHARANLPVFSALGLTAERVHVSYRGIELPGRLPAPAKTHGLMVVAERLVTEKRTDDALRVFAAVSRKIPAAQLLVLGDGPQADTLKALARLLGIAERVTFAGHVPHGAVLEALARAEVALTMSRNPAERLPNVMKEAMLQRCLCLSSRTPGIEELIDDGTNGFVVDLGDVDTAIDRLQAALLDHEAAAAFGHRAQTKIVEKFNVDHLMAERLAQWAALRRNQRAGAAA